MKITVKYFALAAEIAGVEAESLKLAAGALRFGQEAFSSSFCSE